MSLFDNGREANLESCVAMVERALGDLGHQTGATRNTDAKHPEWRFKHGSATVTVSLVPRDDFTHLRVVAPVISTDARVDILKLYRRLLSLHATDVHGAAFATYRNEVHLVADRSTIDLDLSEVHDVIKRVSDYADHYDDILVAEFGGRFASE